MMVITYKPTRRIQDSLPLPVYQPTWRNIVTYIQWFISKVAAADDAAGAEAKLDAANYSNFKFDDDVSPLCFFLLLLAPDYTDSCDLAQSRALTLANWQPHWWHTTVFVSPACCRP
jgi:hypothetical protein